MFLVKTLNLDKGLTFPTTLRGLELGDLTRRGLRALYQLYVFRQNTQWGCYVTALSQVSINTSKPMSIKSKSGNTGKFHFKAICMIAFDTDSLLVK